MKRTISPKISVFDFRPSSFVIFLACFRVFRNNPHSSFFRFFYMDSPDFQACSSLADFKPAKPVKSVKVIIEYE